MIFDNLLLQLCYNFVTRKSGVFTQYLLVVLCIYLFLLTHNHLPRKIIVCVQGSNHGQCTVEAGLELLVAHFGVYKLLFK